MAYYRTQVIFHRTTGLPKDDSVMTFHTVAPDEGPDGTSDTAHAIQGFIAARLDDAVDTGGNKLLKYLSKEVSRTTPPTLKTYDGASPGSPLAVDTMLAPATAFNDADANGAW